MALCRFTLNEFGSDQVVPSNELRISVISKSESSYPTPSYFIGLQGNKDLSGLGDEDVIHFA